jgi:hypothetical protein
VLIFVFSSFSFFPSSFLLFLWYRMARQGGGGGYLCCLCVTGVTHIHIYMYPYIHVYIYTYLHIYIYTYIHIYIYTYIHVTCIHIYIHTYIHIGTYQRLCVTGVTHIHLRCDTHTVIHMYIYTYTYTYRDLPTSVLRCTFTNKLMDEEVRSLSLILSLPHSLSLSDSLPDTIHTISPRYK